MTIVNFEEWAELEMRVGKVKSINKDRAIITCEDKDYPTEIKINAKKSDLIAVGFLGGNIVIPLINKNIPITPESDIEVGAKIR